MCLSASVCVCVCVKHLCQAADPVLVHHKGDLEQLRESKTICEHSLSVKSALARFSEAPGKARERATLSFLTGKREISYY